MPISGLSNCVYRDEGEGTTGIYFLFFKPYKIPNLTVTVRFRDDVGSMTTEQMTESATMIIRNTMDQCGDR